MMASNVFSKLTTCSKKIFLPLKLSLRCSPSLIGEYMRRAFVTSSTVKEEQYNSPQSVHHKPVVMVDDNYDQNTNKSISELIEKVKAVSKRKIEFPNYASYERMLLFLITSEHRTDALDDLLKHEVLERLNSFRPIFLPKLLSTLLKCNCINRPLLKASSERICQLIENDLDDLPDNLNFGQLFWVFGKSLHYNQSLCDSLLTLVTNRDTLLTPWMVGNVAWYCARIQYYNPTLLDRILEYTLNHLDEFPRLQMSNLVYTLGQLNHGNAELMAAVGEVLEREVPPSSEGEQIYWVYMWTSMVLGSIRPGIASRLFDNQFIEASMGGGFHLSVLLQLSIAVNYQHRELGLAGTKSIPSRWGEGFDSIQNVDVKHTRKASIDRLDRYRAGGTASMFSENAKRALTQVVGEDFFNTEVISLSGYIVDFEVLLDSNNKPVRIPRRWKRQWKESVINSIYSNRVRIRKKAPQVSSLIEQLEGAETSAECVTSNDAVLDSKFDLRMRINLASDWGSKFEAIPRRATRRIAIEVDGLIHFAANCDHEMGRTVIKHQQLRALGWEVLQIPYQEWELLKDGDDHVQYLSERIFSVT